jgi:hypothetical protein
MNEKLFITKVTFVYFLVHNDRLMGNLWFKDFTYPLKITSSKKPATSLGPAGTAISSTQVTYKIWAPTLGNSLKRQSVEGKGGFPFNATPRLRKVGKAC